MALSAELEKVLSLITDETEREARRKELTELSENGLRQSDYSRKMNELDAQKRQQAEAHQNNIAWYERAKGQYSSLETDLKAAQERVAALEAAKDFQHQSGNGDFSQDTDLDKQLAEARRQAADATKRLGELDSTVKNFNQMLSDGKLLTAERFEQEIIKRGDALGAALLEIIDLQDRHRRDYGVELNREELLAEAQKRNGSLKEAYEQVTAKARADKLRKDIEADVEKRYQEKIKNSNVPYAPGGEPVIGPLQARLQKKDTGIPDDVQADGTGRLANLIGQELRQEGKF